MANLHFIHDYETFGQDVIKCAIINCAFMTFNWDRFVDDPYTYDELLSGVQYLKLDVEKQVKDGYVIEKSSIDEFWSKMPPDVLKQIRPSENDLTYPEFCDRMLSYFGKDKIEYWWSRSNTFDPILTWRIFNDAGRRDDLQWKLKFWRVRDIRTYIDAVTGFQLDRNGFIPIDETEWKEKFKQHDPRHDIVGDVLRLQRIVRAENGLE